MFLFFGSDSIDTGSWFSSMSYGLIFFRLNVGYFKLAFIISASFRYYVRLNVLLFILQMTGVIPLFSRIRITVGIPFLASIVFQLLIHVIRRWYGEVHFWFKILFGLVDSGSILNLGWHQFTGIYCAQGGSRFKIYTS